MSHEKIDMCYFIPPACEPTVPLLGPYQMAGYAKKVGYGMKIYDLNNLLFHHIIENRSIDVKDLNNSCLDELELCAYRRFLNLYNITTVTDLQAKMKSCQTYGEYWKLVDFVRCCYDLYSFRFDRLRFRLDGVDSSYRWNIWNDIERFVDEYYDSEIVFWMKKQINQLHLKKSQVIGVNITFESQLFFAIMLCKIISESYPENRIVVGGGFVNSFMNSNDSIEPLEKYCDIVNSGEGEALIWYLSTHDNDFSEIFLKEKKSRSRAYYLPAENICKMDLSVCPPEISYEQLNSYYSPFKVIPLRFTYQCYWGKCKFCTDKEYHACLESKYNTSEMIDYCVRSTQNGLIDCIYFLDSAIPYNILKEFCQRIVNEQIQIKWGTNARFDSPYTDEQFIKLLANAGCVFIKFGLESGSQRVLDLMDKGTKTANAEKTIQLCRKYHILVHTYIMFAFPGETDEDRIKTMNFILSDDHHPDNYNCSEFIMYGNSIIAKELKFNFDVSTMTEEGWHSASYSFSNNQIRDQITWLRRKFDEKFAPADILISTGHTIALAHKLQDDKRTIVLTPYSRVTINPSVVICQDHSIVCRWRRRDGIVYFSGENTRLFSHNYPSAYTIQELLNKGLNTNTIYNLINEGFWDLENCADDNTLDYYGDNQIEMHYGNKYNQMKWYGYYDNN